MDTDRRYRTRNGAHRRFVQQEQRPCARCGSMGERDVHRLVPRLGYSAGNMQVLCTACHNGVHYQGKFRVGDKVTLSDRAAAYVGLPLGRPRTIVAVEYDVRLQANLYTLGSNGRGRCTGEPASWGFRSYRFRSYQLIPWVRRERRGRPKRAKRPYSHQICS